MSKDLVAYQVVRFLESRGVECVFGLCGHTVIAMLDALEKSEKVKFVMTRHEQIAAHAADGYARASGKVGVVLSHLGPGLTNATTGVAEAGLDSIPLVVIAGDVPTYYFGRHPHQEVNLHADASQYEIYRPFVKRAFRVDLPELMADVLDRAFRLAVSGRPGPVLVSVPMDVFSSYVDISLFDRRMEGSFSPRRPSLPWDLAEEIVDLLATEERPVIYAGGGVISSGAAQLLRELVEHLQVPVLYTLMGKGAIPDDHPLAVGMTGFWGTPFVNEMAREATTILALGTRMSEADCSSWYRDVTFNIPPSKLVHIDIEPQEIGRNYPTHIGAVSDVKEALALMLKVVKEKYPAGVRRPHVVESIASHKREFAKRNRHLVTSDAYPMRPERILAEVREVLPRDGYIVTDVGWNKNGVGQQFPIYEPGTFVTPGGLATMGFGPAAALGVAIARPDRKVLALVGDGAMGANPSVVATAVQYKLPVVWVVMNNCAFGTIAGLQTSHYGTDYGTVFRVDGKPYSPDFAALAEAYGARGIRVERASDFKGALEKALTSGDPCVVDVFMENAPVPTGGCWNINDIYTRRGEEKPRKF